MFSDNIMTTFRKVTIYGSLMFVFNSGKEDAPWLPAEYASDDPNDLGVIVYQGSQPPYTAYAEHQAIENWRGSAFASIKLLISPDDPVPPPSSVIPVREAILNLAVAADTILYDKLQRLVSVAQRGDTDQSMREKQEVDVTGGLVCIIAIFRLLSAA